MVSLTRLGAVPTPLIPETDVPAVLSEIFLDCFQPIAETVAILTASAPLGEAHVARSLLKMATPKLQSDPSRNESKLRAQALSDLKQDWVATPTPLEHRDSPLLLLGSLSYERAAAFVLHYFSEVDNQGIAKALRCTEAGARHHYKSALITIKDRLNYDCNVRRVFKNECEAIAAQVDPDPEILKRAMREVPSGPRRTNRRLMRLRK